MPYAIRGTRIVRAEADTELAVMSPFRLNKVRRAQHRVSKGGKHSAKAAEKETYKAAKYSAKESGKAGKAFLKFVF